MRRVLLAIVALQSFWFLPSAEAAGKSSGSPKTVHVSGYTKKDGTYVQPHMRSAPRTAVREVPRTEYRATPPSPAEGRSTARIAPPSLIPTGQQAVASEPNHPLPASTGGVGGDTDKREKEAARLLESAKKTEANSRRAKTEGRRAESAILLEMAKRAYDDIITRYSETKAAGEARILLEALKKEA